jgi:hypothetical protein
MNFVGDEYQKERVLVKQAEDDDSKEGVVDGNEESGGELKDDRD